MALLRYMKELKKLNGVGWRILNTHMRSEPINCTSATFKQYQYSIPSFAHRGYATAALPKNSDYSSSSNISYNYDVQIQTFENQLRKFGRVSKTDIEKLLDTIQATGIISNLEALLLIRSCGNPLVEADSMESINLVQELWDTLERLNVVMDVSHYNALLNVYIEKNYPFDSEQILKTMSRKSIVPNRVTYQKLIANYCNCGDIDGATRILSVMNEKGFPLCENVFNSLIIGHGEAKDLTSAAGILKTMETAQVSPTADTYTALIKAYIKNNDIESVKTTMEKLKTSDILLLDVHLLEIVCELAENGFSKEAEDLVKELPKDFASDTEIYKAIVKLLNLKMPHLALDLVVNSSEELTRLRVRAALIIKAAINCKNLSTEEVVSICDKLAEAVTDEFAFSRTIFNSFNNMSDSSLTLTLLRKWKEKGSEIREHYFWPLIVNQIKKHNFDEMMNIIKIMITDFQIKPSIKMLRDYIIPYTFGTWENVIEKLESFGIPKRNIVEAIVDRMLMDRKLTNAASIACNFPVGCSLEILTHAVTAFNVREKPDVFTLLLRNITDNPDNYDPNQMPVSVVDESLRRVMKLIPLFRHFLVENLLKEYVRAGFTISPEVGDELKGFLNQNLTSEVSEAINNLTSGKLTVVPMEEYLKNMNEILQSNNLHLGRNKPQMMELRNDFNQCFVEKNSTKLLDVLKKMETADILTLPIIAQSISLFCESGDLEVAEKYINEIKKMPNAVLDPSKCLKYANLLIQNNRFVDAMAFLNEQLVVENLVKLERKVSTLSKAILESTFERENESNFREMMNLLKDKNLIDLDNFTLGFTIKKYLDENNLKAALDELIQIYEQYNILPYKNRLTIELIKVEDANALQKLTDICTKIYSDSNALADLAFNFLICGKVKQAKKILDTPGLKVSNKKILSSIKYFIQNDKYDMIEFIPQVTKNTLTIDRGFMYESCLDAYVKKNDWKKGLALWTEMQESNVLPTNDFLMKLNSLLRFNNQPVPFTVANRTDSAIEEITNVLTTSRKEQVEELFSNAIESKNYEAAEKIVKQQAVNSLDSMMKFNRLMKSLVMNDQFDKAYSLLKEMINKKIEVHSYTYEKLIDYMVNKEKYYEISELQNLIPENVKSKIRYEKTFSKSKLRQLGLKKYIEEFNNSEIMAKSNIHHHIHFGELVFALLKDPSCFDDFKVWIKKLEKDVPRIKESLWNYYFINGEFEKVDELWKEIKGNGSYLVRPIIQVACKNSNADLIIKLRNFIESHSNLTFNTKSIITSGLIRCYAEQGWIQKALDEINEYTKQYSLGTLQPGSLKKLKETMENDGQNFPYNIQFKRRLIRRSVQNDINNES